MWGLPDCGQIAARARRRRRACRDRSVAMCGVRMRTHFALMRCQPKKNAHAALEGMPPAKRTSRRQELLESDLAFIDDDLGSGGSGGLELISTNHCATLQRALVTFAGRFLERLLLRFIMCTEPADRTSRSKSSVRCGLGQQHRTDPRVVVLLHKL